MANKLRPSDAIINLLKTNLGLSRFKKWYHGDPIYLPKSALPCLIVQPNETRIDTETTAQDKLIHTVTIIVAVSKREEFGKTPDAVVAQLILEDLMIGVDATTEQYDLNTVVGILRKNFTMPESSTSRFTFQDGQIRYGVSDRGLAPASLPTAEAHYRATFRELVIVPSRL